MIRQLLLAAGDRWFVRAAAYACFRAAFQAGLEAVLPGIILHYLVRKRCLEDWARGACDAKKTGAGAIRQLVILGAGLDTLGWRLHRQATDLTIIELDRSAALRVKAAAMTGTWSREGNLILHEANLAAEDLAEVLARVPAFDPTLPTLFLAEGLLMYLSPERVAALWRAMAALGLQAHGNSLAFTFMENRPDGRIRFRRSSPLVDWWLQWKNEPFRWACHPAALASLLEPNGWRLRDVLSDDSLRTRYLDPSGLTHATLAMGEWLAFAEATTSPT